MEFCRRSSPEESGSWAVNVTNQSLSRMKQNLLCPALLAGGLILGSALGQAQAPLPGVLQVRTALEVEFQTEVGKTYTVQGAVGLTNWTDIGSPVLGHGRGVHQIYSTRDTGSNSYAAYRLRVIDGPTNGYAPWSMSSIRVQMDNSSSTNLVQYVADDHG